MPKRLVQPDPPLKALITLEIRSPREAAGLRLVDLEAVTGLSRSLLSSIERLERDPPLSLFVRLARHYQQSPYDFFGFVGFPRPHCCHCEQEQPSRI
jgi:transcriptional regulator with XRE-family HTH domain